MSAPGADLASRFAAHVRAAEAIADGDGLVVALSGGADSVVLLHLLRFTPGLPSVTLVAAHVDHAMRASSSADADWVGGLCRAWDVPLVTRRLDRAPASEVEARRLRYGVLEETRRAAGASWVATAHHADDQAETVLFRAVRGTGPAGLRGIRERRPPGVWRPLLPFTRGELRAYAAARRIGWREDPTNALPLARNVLRNDVIPLVEDLVAPGARRALAGLARRASADEAAWRSVEALLLSRVGLRQEPDGVSVDRDALVGLHPAVRARLVRGLARRLGVVVPEAGTRRAVEFTTAGSSGTAVPLGHGLSFGRELNRLHLGRGTAPGPDLEALVDSGGPGHARAVVGGVAFDVRWRDGSPGGAPEEIGLGRHALDFPLVVRGWRPGDRIRLSYGSKKLKKVLLEARVPPAKRRAMPVVADAGGAVIWIPGVARAEGTDPESDNDAMTLRIVHAESD